jgi:hypothetical protein
MVQDGCVRLLCKGRQEPRFWLDAVVERLMQTSHGTGVTAGSPVIPLEEDKNRREPGRALQLA